jgi:acyl-CoA thioester hydrolase
MSLQLRVYYADTDCGGVVYYANYLKYMEAGRMEFMRECGADLSEWQKRGTLFVVIETNVKYRSPARLNDLLDITTTLTEKLFTTLAFATEIRNQTGTILVSSLTRLACLNDKGKVIKIPEEIRKALGEQSQPA